MAKYHIEEYSNEPNKYGFGMPLNMRRSNPDPLDNSSVVSSYEALTAYAAPKAEGDIAYVGQQVTVVKKSGAKFDVQAYQIADEAGRLRKLLYSDNAIVDELSVGKLTVDFENLINGRSGSPYLNLSVLQLCIELSVDSLCCEVEDNYLNLSGGVIKQKGMHFGTLPEVEIRPKHIIVKGESNSDVGHVDSVTISCDRIVKDFGWRGTSDEPKTYMFPLSSGTLATEESVNGLVSSNYVWLSGGNTQARSHAISGDNEFVGGKTSISALSIGTQLEYGDASGSWLSAKGTMLYTNLIDISANNADVTNGTGALKSSNYSHAEGNATSATGTCSHAEGFQTFAKMPYSHAEGFQTYAGDPTSPMSYGQGNHSEGGYTSAFGGSYNHAEGNATLAFSNWGAHAEGNATSALNDYAHAEGLRTLAKGEASKSLGQETSALADNSIATGYKSIVSGVMGVTFGDETIAGGRSSIAAGYKAFAKEFGAVAVGQEVKAIAQFSIAEGGSTAANGNYSHAAGYKTTVDASYAFGWSGTSTSVYTVPLTRAGTFNIDPVGGISGFYIGNKSLNEIIGDDVLVSVDYLSGAIDALSVNLSTDIQNLSTSLSGDIKSLSTSLSTEISNLSSKLSSEIDNLSGTHNFLSNAISSKVFISSYIDEEQMHGPSDLSIIKIAKDEYDALVADNHPTLSANTLYVVDSDYIDAYGQVISNLAMDENDPSYMLGLAATKPYVDREVASLSAQLSGISKVIKDDSILRNGISMSSEMSVILSAMVLIFSKLSAF